MHRIMSNKSPFLAKRKSNRMLIRPCQSPADKLTADELPSAPSPLWNYSKLYIPEGQMDLEWQPSVGTVFKVFCVFK